MKEEITMSNSKLRHRLASLDDLEALEELMNNAISFCACTRIFKEALNKSESP
jgi:hypothetical protein